MLFRCFVLSAFLHALMVAGGHAAFAQAADPHTLYEQRCAACHAPHAGEFVADSLMRLDGSIVGRRAGEELRALLSAGHGRLDAQQVDTMVAHLTAILAAGGLFREHCRICHGRAVVLARHELVLRDGRLTGRYSGRDIAAFLRTHGRLEGDEIPTVVRMLERQLATETAK